MANATFYDSHSVDSVEKLWFAMDLTPLIHDLSLDPVDYALSFIRRFENDVREAIGTHFP